MACSRTANEVTTTRCTASVAQMDLNDNLLPKWLIPKERRGWRRAVQNFTPSWFATTMGTGIVSVLLNTLATLYPSCKSIFRPLGITFFALNSALFVSILIISILRYTMFPATWGLMLRHPVQSLFLGTLPMGFATIVNMFVAICIPAWDGASPYIAWAMWWLDVVISVACCLWLPFQMMTTHKQRHENMTAAWLLPIVSCIVATASGGVVASVLPDSNHALVTLVTSYVLWGMGILLAFMVMTIYFHRLAIYGLPPQEVIVSVFLPLGPMGQGGYGIMQFGKIAAKVFPATGVLHPMAGDVLYVLGWITALILWGVGLVWLVFAVASISRSRFPFNMGWWGFTFPVGVFAMSTITIGLEMSSGFFKIFGTALTFTVIVLWFIVATKTVRSILNGNLFEAPCLREIEKRPCAIMEEQEQQGV